MACGTPVVGSNVGGIKYTVRDGESGYLVPARDPDKLAERLAHLYQHPKLLSVLSRQAIQRANDLFTWERIVGAIAAVYDEVLSTGQTECWDGAMQAGTIERAFDDLIEVVQQSRRLKPFIAEAAEALGTCLSRGNKVLVCGNGGSAADAQHFATDLVGRFKRAERPGLPVLALTADGAFLTAWADDVGYEKVFARQVEAFGQSGDVLVGLSASGHCRSLLEAFEAARARGLRCVALLGQDSGDARQLADIAVIVPSTDKAHVQEAHLMLLHLLCELIEERLAAGVSANGATRPASAGTNGHHSGRRSGRRTRGREAVSRAEAK